MLFYKSFVRVRADPREHIYMAVFCLSIPFKIIINGYIFCLSIYIYICANIMFHRRTQIMESKF